MRDFRGLMKIADSDSWLRPLGAAATLAVPIVASAMFRGRGRKLAGRFMQLYKNDLVKGRRALAGAVNRHIRSTGASLPRYRSVSANEILSGRAAQRGVVPVLSGSLPGDLMANQVKSIMDPGGMSDFAQGLVRAQGNSIGPMYSPNAFTKGKKWHDVLFGRRTLSPGANGVRVQNEFIGLPPTTKISPDPSRLTGLRADNFYSPKTLLHELGHAKDVANGEFTAGHPMFRPSLKNWMKDTYYGFANPDKTRTVANELRAWNNARIPVGDELRESALATYRNAVRAKSLGRLAWPLAIGGASAAMYGGRE